MRARRGPINSREGAGAKIRGWVRFFPSGDPPPPLPLLSSRTPMHNWSVSRYFSSFSQERWATRVSPGWRTSNILADPSLSPLKSCPFVRPRRRSRVPGPDIGPWVCTAMTMARAGALSCPFCPAKRACSCHLEPVDLHFPVPIIQPATRLPASPLSLCRQQGWCSHHR